MSAHRSSQVLLLSAIAALFGVLLAMIGSALPASVQGASWVTTMTGPPQRKATRDRQRTQQPAPADVADTTEPPRVVLPSAAPGLEPDPSADPQDGDDPAQIASQRPGDGDPQADPSMLRDGIVETGEPGAIAKSW